MTENIPEEQLLSALAGRYTKEMYKKIRSSKIAVAGLGGLGSNIAVSLCRLGVPELLLADFDKVDISNLNRQQYFISDIGRYKTDALSDRLLEINPYIKLKTVRDKVTEENVQEIFGGFGIVCEAFDKAESKSMLINTLLEKCPGTKIISGSGMAGYFSSNMIKTKRQFRDLYICGDMTSDINNDGGLTAPRVMICAGHQANMALRLILGIEEI